MVDFINDLINNQNKYQSTEVGLTHPNWPSFIKLRDTGEIEIFAGEGCSIVLTPQTKTITFIADQVKFITKENDGLRWNQKKFNSNATTYEQPSLISIPTSEMYNPFKGVFEVLNANKPNA